MGRIDLYIYEVTRRLPEKTRMDIEMELRSTILDMIPEDYSESDVDIALTQLGDPSKLANKYLERPSFLIGPKLFDSYLTILKMAALIGLLVILVVQVVEYLTHYSGEVTFLESLLSFIGNFVGNVIEMIVYVFFWVTIFFTICERVVDDKTISSMKLKPWTTSDLDQVIPVKREKRISRVETFFALLGTAILGTLYFKASDILGIYEKSESNDKLQLVEPLFNQDVLLSYWPFVVALIVFEISFILYKWMVGYWTNKMAILNTINHIVFIMFTVLLINLENIFNVGFIHYIGELFNVENGHIQGMWNKWIWGMVIVVIVFSVLDTLEGFRKSKK